MAEGGQLSEDLSRTMKGGLDGKFEFYCYLCHEEDRHVEACGYCKDCSDYLCEDCYKSHCRPKPMRHHVLLDRQHMLKDLNSSHNGLPLDRCTDICIKHSDKVIEYYCQTHDTLGCSTCAFVDHRSCENVDHIPDVADRIDQSKEFKDMQDKLRYLERKACQILQDSQDNISVSNKYSNDAVTAGQAYIQEIISTLDKLKVDLNAESEKLQSENEKRLKAALTRSNAMLLEVRGTIQGLSMLQKNKQNCNLFVAVKKAQTTLPTVAMDVDRTEYDSKAAEFKFEPNLQFRNILHKQRAIGQIVVSHHTSDGRGYDSNRAGIVTVPDPGHGAGIIPKCVIDPNMRGNTTTSGDISHSSEPIPRKAEESAPKIATDPKMRKRNKAKPPIGCSSLTNPGKNATTLTRDNRADTPSVDCSPSPRNTSTGNKNIPNYDERKNISARHVTDIKVYTKRDKQKCYISGVVVLPGDKLVAMDYQNNKVKIIDTRKQKLIQDFMFQSGLWDVTSVDNDEVAVTLPYAHTIQYLKISRDGTVVSIRRGICVNGRYHGIAFVGGRLCVSYTQPKKVEMLTQDHEVQLGISADAAGQQILTDPRYIAVSPDRKTLYVSDYHKEAIIRLSSTGKVLTVYKDDDFHCPTGIAVAADGTVYVCDDGGRVHMLTAQCEKIKMLLDVDQVGGTPQCLAYNEATRQLFIGMLYRNYIKVFQLS